MSACCSAVLAQTSRTIERLCAELIRPALGNAPPAARRMLDVGCWEGEATMKYARTLEARAWGVEIFAQQAQAARARGVAVAQLDLERDAFPWESAYFEVAIANQVFEHLKNVCLPLAEIWRTLRPGGWFIASVPNLASLHNRVLLALGIQPTSIRALGPHVRGYTHREIQALVRLGGAFEIERSMGVGFYPIPARWSALMCVLWPAASHTTVVVSRKSGAVAAAPWLAWLEGERSKAAQTSWK